MSVIKIEKDFKSLESELKEIGATITDPIERNERKKDLNKKISKLKRTKDQIEKLELERQELESLKSDLIVNSDKLNEFTESQDSDKPTLKRYIEVSRQAG